ncbi:MAG: PEGA domain-containing protein [Patescibacteria group bacterium]
MKPFSRKILLSAAIFCFLVIAPAISLYAIGYRLDLATKSIKQTGVLILESTPKNAEIFLNDKQISQKTPAKIKNLLPGDYKIKIAKDNYIFWEKKLPIISRQTTWASYITLFYEIPKTENLTTHTLSDFILTSNSDKLFYFVETGDDKGIWQLTLNEKNKNIKIFPQAEDLKRLSNFANSKLDAFSLSPNNQKNLLHLLPYGYFILNLTDNKTTYLSDFTSSKIENVKWDYDNSEKVYFTNEAGLFQIDLRAKNTSPIIVAADILDYETSSSKIFYLAKNSKKNNVLLNELGRGNRKNHPKTKILNKIQKADNMILKISSQGYLAYLDRDRGRLYLYNGGKQKIIAQNSIKDFLWSQRGNKLLYFGDHEIWFYNIQKEEIFRLGYKSNVPNLITRLSLEIKNALFFDEEHIAFIQENKAIKIIELDGRDKQNTYEIKANPYQDKIFFNKNKTQIYYIDEDSRNLKAVEIREK